MNLYGNQNRSVNRNRQFIEKVASPFDEQLQFNRKKKPIFKFASLSPEEGEEIVSYMKKEAEVLNKEPIDKTASMNPFELFGNAKHYATKKLGISDTTAHDVAGSVIGKAQQLSEQHGGEVADMAMGIIDQMDPNAFPEVATGLISRTMTTQGQDQYAKELLMEQLQLSSYDADRYKKSVVAAARSLYTKHRTKRPDELSQAVVSLLVERRDVSLVFDISSNEQLKREIEMKLI